MMNSIAGLRRRPYTIWIHLLVWIAYFLMPLLFIESAQGRERYIIYGWFMDLLMVVYFYLNYSYLIPRFLLRRKIKTYSLLLVLGFIAVCGLYVLYSYAYHNTVEHRHPFNLWRSLFFPIYPMIMAFALSSTIRITTEWFRNERQKKEMESEKLSSELAFLKSQVNPHFLFNILNNICSLARKKSDETENAIIKLSQIMRYMLQDSKDEKVTLEKEIEYLHSYIELQRLRLPDSVRVDFSIDGRPELVSIEPLLLIPFVENAFKHGVTFNESSEITIRLSVLEQGLRFVVCNHIARHEGESAEMGSGIGLKNVTRRLELLYPGRHQLIIQDDGKKYHVELALTFES